MFENRASKMVRRNNRSCPVCGGKNSFLLHSIDFAEKAEKVLPKNYRIVSCDNCGFVFDDIKATARTFKRYYKKTSKYFDSNISGGGLLTDSDINRYKSIVDYVKPYLSDKKLSIADFGAGNGGLLKAFLDSGYKNVFAYEGSKQMTSNIKKNYGIASFCVDLISLRKKADYDLALCCQVFEHLFSPQKVLSRIRDTVSDGGLLYLEVPDASKYAEYFISPYHYFDVEHINHFSFDYLKYLLSNEGFEVMCFDSFDLYLQSDLTYPSFRCIAKKTEKRGEGKSFSLLDKKYLTIRINEYIQKSKQEEEKQKRLLETISGKVCLWGIGSYSKRLIESGVFSDIDITVLVDVNKSLWGTKVKQWEVMSPNFLQGKEELTVLITSVVYHKEIEEQLKELKFKGKIVLYI